MQLTGNDFTKENIMKIRYPAWATVLVVVPFMHGCWGLFSCFHVGATDDAQKLQQLASQVEGMNVSCEALSATQQSCEITLDTQKINKNVLTITEKENDTLEIQVHDQNTASAVFSAVSSMSSAQLQQEDNSTTASFETSDHKLGLQVSKDIANNEAPKFALIINAHAN